MSHTNTYTLEFVDTSNNIVSTYEIKPEFDDEARSRDALIEHLKEFLAENYTAIQARLIDRSRSFTVGPVEFIRKKLTEIDPDVSRIQQLRAQIARDHSDKVAIRSTSPQQSVMSFCATSVPTGPTITSEMPTHTPEQILATIPQPANEDDEVALILEYEEITLYTGGPYLDEHARTVSQQPTLVNIMLGKDRVTVLPDSMPSGEQADVQASRLINRGTVMFFRKKDHKKGPVTPAQTTAHTMVGISETRDSNGVPVFVAATDACVNHFGTEKIAGFSATGYAQVVLAAPIAQMASKIPMIGSMVQEAVRGGTPGPYFEVILHPVEVDEGRLEIQVLFRGSCFPRMILNLSIQIPGVEVGKSARSYALYIDPSRPDQSVNGAAYEKLFTADSFEIVSRILVNRKTGEIISYHLQTLAESPELLEALEEGCSDESNAAAYLYADRMRRHFSPGCSLGHSMNALRVEEPGLVFQAGWGRLKNLIGRAGAWFNGLLNTNSSRLVVHPTDQVQQDRAHARPLALHCTVGESLGDIFGSLQASSHCVTRIDLETVINEHTVLDEGFRIMESIVLPGSQQSVDLARLKEHYLLNRERMLEILFANQMHFSGDDTSNSRTIRYKQVRWAISVAIGNIHALVNLIHSTVQDAEYAGVSCRKISPVFSKILKAAWETQQKLENYYINIVLENDRREDTSEAQQRAIAKDALDADVAAFEREVAMSVPRPFSTRSFSDYGADSRGFFNGPGGVEVDPGTWSSLLGFGLMGRPAISYRADMCRPWGAIVTRCQSSVQPPVGSPDDAPYIVELPDDSNSPDNGPVGNMSPPDSKAKPT